MYKYLIFLAGCMLLMATKCNDKIETSNCSTLGTVKDYTGLDGCKFLIELDNGEKLQPMNEGKSKLDLKDGQRIKFDYYEETGQMSICMAGKMVQVTCFEILKDEPGKTGGVKPIKKPCIETMNPYETEWMSRTMESTNAYQVIRYTYRTDGWAYYFMGPIKNMMLDCQGTLICECGARDSKCDNQAKNYLDELVIWERD